MIDRINFPVSDTVTGSSFISTFLNNVSIEILCSIFESVNNVSDQASNVYKDFDV